MSILARALLLTLSVPFALAVASAQPLRLSELERRHGSVVALVADASSGRTLGGIRVSEAHREQYPPGSLFKIAIAIAALEGDARTDYTHRCGGSDTLAGHVYRCWLDAGHGELGLSDAIARSCNLYFRGLARSISRSSLAQRAGALGLLPRDHTARIDDDALLGDAAPVSPRMLMSTALSLASRGRLSSPTLPLGSPLYRPLYDGLRECVRTGTAQSAWTARIAIAGKTGTVEQAAGTDRNAGWFIGFAPVDRPRYAVVVLHRTGRGSDAAAVAREIIETLL